MAANASSHFQPHAVAEDREALLAIPQRSRRAMLVHRQFLSGR
jgi:hypothetical protein